MSHPLGTLWSRVSSLVIKNGLPTDISPSLSLSTTNRTKQDTAILPFSKEMTNQFHIQILDYMSYDPRNQKKTNSKIHPKYNTAQPPNIWCNVYRETGDNIRRSPKVWNGRAQ